MVLGDQICFCRIYSGLDIFFFSAGTACVLLSGPQPRQIRNVGDILYVGSNYSPERAVAPLVFLYFFTVSLTSFLLVFLLIFEGCPVLATVTVLPCFLHLLMTVMLGLKKNHSHKDELYLYFCSCFIADYIRYFSAHMCLCQSQMINRKHETGVMFEHTVAVFTEVSNALLIYWQLSPE